MKYYKCKRLFVCTFVSAMLLPLFLTAAQISMDQQSRYHTGINLLESGQLQAAKNHFQSWLEQQPQAPFAMLGLGRMLTADQPADRKGRELLRKAADHPFCAGEAFYHLALSHSNEGEDCLIQAMLYLKKAQKADPHFVDTYFKMVDIKEFQFLAPKASVEILGQGLMANPDHPDLYKSFIEKAYFNHEVPLGIEILQKLKTLKKDSTSINLDLVYFHLLQESWEPARQLLNRLAPLSDHADLGCRFHYLLAQFSLLTDTPKAEDLYWMAASKIHTGRHLDLFKRDLRYVMTKSEWDNFNGAVPASPELVLRFWQKRDPNPFAHENKRLRHYYQTLFEGRRFYRRLTNVRPHYDGFGANDIDDMALVLLRHGKPDEILCPQREGLTGNKIFTYYNHNNRPEWTLFLNHYNRKGVGWVLQPLPIAFESLNFDLGLGIFNRQIIEILANAAEPGDRHAMNVARFMMEFEGERVKEWSVPIMQAALVTETAEETLNEPLEIPLVARYFREKPDQWHVSLYHLVEGREVDLAMNEGRFVLPLSYAYTAKDSCGNVLFRASQQKTIPISADPQQWAGQSALLCEELTVPMNTASLDLHILNRNDNRLAHYSLPCRRRDLGGSRLCLSDAILSNEVTASNEQARFARRGWSFEPHMFSTFRKGESVGIYSEIYNLTLDEKGRNQYQIEWKVETPDGRQLKELGGVVNRVKSLFAKKQSRVGSQSTLSGKSRDEALVLNLDLSHCSDSLLMVTLKVTDLISKESASMLVPVSLDV